MTNPSPASPSGAGPALSADPATATASPTPAAPPGPTAARPAWWSWSRRNLAAIAVLGLGLLILAGWRSYRNRAILNEDLTVSSVPMSAAAERINPNTASWASLSRLPGIGPSHAKAIVSYRQAFAASHDGRPAFARAQDLDDVPGIGAKTVEEIAPYLEFPTPATSAPAAPTTAVR